MLAAVERGLRGPETVRAGDLLLDLRARRVMRGDEEASLAIKIAATSRKTGLRRLPRLRRQPSQA